MNETHITALMAACHLTRPQAERAVRADAEARSKGLAGFTALAGGTKRTTPKATKSATRGTEATRAGVEKIAAGYYRERNARAAA
jgi:hypothetical protein